MADFYEIDFMKGVILVKVDEVYKSLLTIVYWSKDEGGIGCSKFLLESALECPYAYYVPPLLKGST